MIRLGHGSEVKMDKEFIANPVEAYENLKRENERLNRCLIEALNHEKEALDVSVKYKETLQEIKDFVNSSRNKLIYLITKAEEE